MKPIAVLGAGLAGLTAAAELKRRGLPAVVFEAGKAVGGMAASFKDAEGFSYDYGAHFISNRLAKALGAEDICRTVRHYGEAVHIDGRDRSHPFGLMAEPRFLASALKSRFASRPTAPAANAEDWMRRSYGDAMAEEVAMPLVEAWSGAPARELSSSVGEKFGNSIVKSLYLSAAAKVTRRPCATATPARCPKARASITSIPRAASPGCSSRPCASSTARCASSRRWSASSSTRAGWSRSAARAPRSRSRRSSHRAVNVLPRLVEGTDALKPLRRSATGR